MKKLKIPIYKQSLLVSNKISDFEKFCKKNNYSFQSIEHLNQTLGCVGVLAKNDDEGFPTQEGLLYMYVSEEASVATIVHESVHAAMMLCEHIGINISPDDQEPYAYLTAYIFEEYCKMYKLLPDEAYDDF